MRDQRRTKCKELVDENPNGLKFEMRKVADEPADDNIVTSANAVFLIGIDVTLHT